MLNIRADLFKDFFIGISSKSYIPNSIQIRELQIIKIFNIPFL